MSDPSPLWFVTMATWVLLNGCVDVWVSLWVSGYAAICMCVGGCGCVCLCVCVCACVCVCVCMHV